MWRGNEYHISSLSKAFDAVSSHTPVDATEMQTMGWEKATDNAPSPLCPIPRVGYMATGTAGEKVRCFNKDKCKGMVLDRNKWCTTLVRNI